MTDAALFDLPDGAVIPAVAAAPAEKLSADRRRTIRQAATLAKGWHPLGDRLHSEAAPADDRGAPGRRCATCQFRTLFGKWPKCTVDGLRSLRMTHGPATDCRAWWPACARYAPEAVADAA